MAEYRALLTTPGAARLIATALFARLPLGMCSLAILLLLRERTGSFAVAGVAVGAYSLGSAATAPVQGALVDRVGQARVLLPSAAVQALLLVALDVAADARAADLLLVALAALAGAAVPPISASARALWPSLVREHERLEAMYALDAITQELIWMAGPLLVGVIVAAGRPDLALGLCAAIAAVGTTLFCATPLSRAWRSGGGARVRGGALRSASLRLLLLSILLTGAAWGSLMVGLPALAVHVGSAGDAGLLLTLSAVGSLAGGLAYGARTWATPLTTRYAVLLCVVALTAAPLLKIGALALAVPLAIVAGAGWAPLMSCQYALVGRAAPAGSVTEAFTWNTSAFVGGIASGSAAGGALAEHAGAGAPFAALCACALAAAAIAIGARSRLRLAA